MWTHTGTHANTHTHTESSAKNRGTRSDTSSHKHTGSRAHLGDLVQTWPQIHLCSVSELIVCQPASSIHSHTDLKMNRILVPLPVTAYTSVPRTEAFKDNGWLLRAPERSLVEITGARSKIDSLEETQIDIMCLLIGRSTKGLFLFSAREKKYPKHFFFAFPYIWKFILIYTHRHRKLYFSFIGCGGYANFMKFFPAKYDFVKVEKSL